MATSSQTFKAMFVTPFKGRSDEAIKKEFHRLLKKEAYPANSEYTDYYGARNVLIGILTFFGTESFVDYNFLR